MNWQAVVGAVIEGCKYGLAREHGRQVAFEAGKEDEYAKALKAAYQEIYWLRERFHGTFTYTAIMFSFMDDRVKPSVSPETFDLLQSEFDDFAKTVKLSPDLEQFITNEMNKVCSHFPEVSQPTVKQCSPLPLLPSNNTQ